ncbi:MAG TPA: aminotransferase class V-fold PLP-dependent enzyme [Gaiellaceae bacterium]|jgi:selenocysteine lyase/cysteine desulfurase|nr:aminotransferase class V-fold PLP-dependent enzyme [Gaiellaceae bacterium]
MTRPVSSGPLPDRIRHRFPIFERLVYINTCSQGALSDAVRDSYEQYLHDWEEQGAPWDYWVEREDAARAAFAGLLNAAPDEVAVTTSLSAGVSALASGLRYARRSKIVTTELEFPTVGQIWHAQESRGARVVHVPLDRFEQAIDDDTAVVSITHVSYRTGEMIDVKEVARLAHERGALVLLDAYQSVGSVPIDVKELGVDFLAAGTVKYLLGSAGLGFFYCGRDVFEKAWPTATGWFADRDIFEMDIHDYSPASTARRFQAGTPPVPSIYAGIAGIELMQSIGIEDTREHVLSLNAHLVAGLDELDATVVTPTRRDRHGALICVKSKDVEALVAALGRRGIVTSSRDGNVRISAHAYNSIEDVEAVLQALAANRELLA